MMWTLSSVAVLFGSIVDIWKSSLLSLPLLISFTMAMSAEFGQSP